MIDGYYIPIIMYLICYKNDSWLFCNGYIMVSIQIPTRDTPSLHLPLNNPIWLS